MLFLILRGLLRKKERSLRLGAIFDSSVLELRFLRAVLFFQLGNPFQCLPLPCDWKKKNQQNEIKIPVICRQTIKMKSKVEPEGRS